jgi:BirA family biotin operon repressor/biotin-[acetyl-CoA-carboxylase] ligase
MTAEAATRLRELLNARGVDWPGRIHHFEEIDSTNRWLRERGLEGAAAWTVVLADRQTAGRGRAGRHWWSPAGGLYVSVLLEAGTHMDATRPGVLSLMGGLAVAEALRESGVEARLKWPNDVRVGGRKIAGILAEAVRGRRVVLGIGVNVASLAPESAEPSQWTVTALCAEGGRESDPLAVCAAVLGRLTLCYDALATAGLGPILDRWRALAEPWWGRTVEFQTGEGRASGTALGIDSEGALIVDRGDGRRERLLSGDVTEVRLSGDDARSHDAA